jgi:hypothetical protein
MRIFKNLVHENDQLAMTAAKATLAGLPAPPRIAPAVSSFKAKTPSPSLMLWAMKSHDGSNACSLFCHPVTSRLRLPSILFFCSHKTIF